MINPDLKFPTFFRQRLELMREMYQNGAEMSPGSPDVNLEHANGSDPFYDRFVQSFGVSSIKMFSL